MDMHNTFHSRGTYRLMRLDYFAVLLMLAIVVLAHAHEVRWGRFAIAFWWIDVVGTIPAWIVYYGRRRGAHRKLPPIYYRLYNFAHSLATNTLLVALWYAALGGWEWAMLAAPIHILGDRALFGNVYKPRGLAFEPVAHPAYEQFMHEYQRSGHW